MKSRELRARLRKDRPMTSITIRMPGDVIKELKRIAPLLGFSGYQPLIRAYIGQGLRRDLEKIESRPKLNDLVKSLRRYGVAEEVISSAIAELRTA
ncbi:MAG: hypothetical protein LAO21_22295 [Acidobacteriia bacterium]|nr:hypothetical protein [Terriglobia bacterium]